MAERMPNMQRQVGGIYLIGQVITTGNVINTYTAYNRNTNDVVGLSMLELPATLSQQAALQTAPTTRTTKSCTISSYFTYT